MINLYNELMNGTVEYKDGGVIVQHPPTATSMRAARTIKQLSEINGINANLIDQLQASQAELLKIQEMTYANIKILSAKIAELTKEKEEYESIRKSQQQVSDVGSANGELSRGDSDSEGSGTNFFAGSSVD